MQAVQAVPSLSLLQASIASSPSTQQQQAAGSAASPALSAADMQDDSGSALAQHLLELSLKAAEEFDVRMARMQRGADADAGKLESSRKASASASGSDYEDDEFGEPGEDMEEEGEQQMVTEEDDLLAEDDQVDAADMQQGTCARARACVAGVE